MRAKSGARMRERRPPWGGVGCAGDIRAKGRGAEAGWGFGHKENAPRPAWDTNTSKNAEHRPAVLLALVAVAPARAVCTDGQIQYSCHTTGENETIAVLASQFHLHKARLCDWNRPEIVDCDSILPEGVDLKVPPGCVPQIGQWDCYEVAEGDTLSLIAKSPRSFWRNLDKLLEYNDDTLWDETALHPGMHIRLPIPTCMPQLCENSMCLHICYTLQESEKLSAVGDKFNMTEADLLDMNKVLGGVSDLHAGVQILVRHPCPHVPTTESTKWSHVCNDFWVPHVVKPGDTLYALGQQYKVDYNMICQVNKIDCTKYGVQINVGVPLTIPSQQCEPVAGQVVCVTVPVDTSQPDPLKREPWALFQTNPSLCSNANTKGCGRLFADPMFLSGSPAIGPFNSPAGIIKQMSDQPESLAFLQSFYSKNSHLFAQQQTVCDVSTTPPQCKTTTCAQYPNDGFENCVAYEGMVLAVSYVPCIPDRNSHCLPLTLNGATDWVTWWFWSAGGTFPSMPFTCYALDGFSPADQLSTQATGLLGPIPPEDTRAGSGGSKAYTNSFAINVSPVPMMKMPFVQPDVGDGNLIPSGYGAGSPYKLCTVQTGENGNLCYKFRHNGTGGIPPYGPHPEYYNESIWTVAREFGVDTGALCASNGYTKGYCAKGEDIFNVACSLTVPT
jgi:LysM repeat protein